MKRKFLSLVLALVMVLGTVSAVFAETTPLTTNDSKIQWLVDNEVVVGRTVNKDDTNPDLALDKTITRAEVSKLLVYTLGQEKLADVLKGAIRVFPDVDLDHWANGYVSVLATNRTEVASGRDVVIGYEDGTFRPSNDVTYAELATMLVRIVKKDLTKKMEDEAIWATSYIRWAEELGILEGITLVNSDAPAVRKDAFVMIYNAMHKLDLIGKNKVDWGIKIGVVSKLQAGKMEINQDKEQVYNFTYNTVVTNGTNWNEVNVNTVVPGSLVRFIADENGNISHLLVVSVPEFGDTEDIKDPTQNGPTCKFVPGNKYSGWHRTDNSRIFDLGQKVAGAVGGNIKFTESYRPIASLVVTDGYCGNANPVNISMTSKTRVFVADPSNNALKEMKSLSEALRVYNKSKDTFKGFVIYDQFKNYANLYENEATVVVLTEVDKYHGEQDVLRVRYTPNGLYNVELENTKGEEVVKNLHGLAYLPGSYGLERMDVVNLRTPVGHSDGQLTNIVIDYSADNVYRVMSIADRYIILRDQYGFEAKLGMPSGTRVFLERDLRVDAHVQIAKNATQDNVKVISVVDKPLKGALDFVGVDTGFQTGWIYKTEGSGIAGGYKLVTLADKVNGKFVNFRTVLASDTINHQYYKKVDGYAFARFFVEEGWNYETGKRVTTNWTDLIKAAEDLLNDFSGLAPTYSATVTKAELETARGDIKDKIDRYNDIPAEALDLVWSASQKATFIDDLNNLIKEYNDKVDEYKADHPDEEVEDLKLKPVFNK